MKLIMKYLFSLVISIAIFIVFCQIGYWLFPDVQVGYKLSYGISIRYIFYTYILIAFTFEITRFILKKKKYFWITYLFQIICILILYLSITNLYRVHPLRFIFLLFCSFSGLLFSYIVTVSRKVCK